MPDNVYVIDPTNEPLAIGVNFALTIIIENHSVAQHVFGFVFSAH
jgi:hypothetical protein